jgi:hypothetical protein
MSQASMTDFFPKRQALATEASEEAPSAAASDAETEARPATNKDNSSLGQLSPSSSALPSSDATFVLAQFLGGAAEIDLDGDAHETAPPPSSAAEGYHFSFKFQSPDQVPSAEPAVEDVACKEMLLTDAFFEQPLCRPTITPDCSLPHPIICTQTSLQTPRPPLLRKCRTTARRGCRAQVSPPTPFLQSHLLFKLNSYRFQLSSEPKCLHGLRFFGR